MADVVIAHFGTLVEAGPAMAAACCSRIPNVPGGDGARKPLDAAIIAMVGVRLADRVARRQLRVGPVDDPEGFGTGFDWRFGTIGEELRFWLVPYVSVGLAWDLVDFAV